ncbi:MAG TPA: hypothetical protein VGF45_13365 [Polyangia bacterium]
MKSKRITAYADRPRDFRDTVVQLEYGYAALSSFFPKVELGTVEVLFMDGVEMAHEFGAQRGGMVFPTVPGATGIGRSNLIVMTVDNGYVQSTALLSHLFLHKLLPNAPLWLHVSLAEYFSRVTVKHGDGRWVACFGQAAPLDVRFFRMPLDQFFSISWQDYANSNPGFYRGTAHLLMDFVFHGDQNAHRAKLPAIFGAVAQNMSGPAIMAATFPGMNLEQLGERLSSFKGSQAEQLERDRMCPLGVPIQPNKIPDESELNETPISPKEIEPLMLALKKLPQGDKFPSWHPPEVLGLSPPAAAP